VPPDSACENVNTRDAVRVAFSPPAVQSEHAISGVILMPDEKKLDPFKPQQPNIPGVPTSEGQAGPGARRVWVPLVVAGVLIISIGAFFMRNRLSFPKPAQASPSPAAVTPPSPPVPVPVPKATAYVPVAPGEVATTDELAKAWSAKRFLFRNPATGETIPAMVVRLPDGEYWGFSLRAPFGDCDMEYVADLGALQTKYDFSADHPMVGDPCTHSVFDLLKYGSTPDGTIVRGEIEKGGAIRPPIAIEIREEGNEIRAVRIE
jgi:hypothetical protein